MNLGLKMFYDRPVKIKVDRIFGLIILLVVAGFGALVETLPKAEVLAENSIADLEYVKVIRVIDGDTLEAEGGVKIRYIGVDTPETKDPRKDIECMGKEAYLRNKQLVEGKTIGLERDVSDTDRYGRLLRYVYIDGEMVNRIMVAEGMAKAVTYPPDVANQVMLKEAEQEAREANKGLWNKQACIN